jgi:hypothetical protein
MSDCKTKPCFENMTRDEQTWEIYKQLCEIKEQIAEIKAIVETIEQNTQS